MDTSNQDQKIIQLYLEGESTHTIAKMFSTYPNKIKRVLNKNNIQLRDRREAQANSEQQGRYNHPTKGTSHSPEVRAKISEQVHNQWNNLSDKEKAKRKKIAKDNWKNLTSKQKEDLRQKAHVAIRRAADIGSKLENFLVDYFLDNEIEVIHHSKHKVATDQMEIDILLPSQKIVIEIDGPSHYEPIWGEKSLERHQKADSKKNGILLANGFHVVRIRDKSKKITRKIERELIQQVVEVMEKLDTAKKPQLVFLEIG